MSAKRISAKLFFDKFDGEAADFVPLFHRWIQTHALPGVLLDVANYAHVPDGPLIMLIGHEGDWVIDAANGRIGLAYIGKRGWDALSLAQRVAETVARLWLAAQLISADKGLNGRFTFDTSGLQIAFLDRLQLPNTAETFTAVQPDIEAALTQQLPGVGVQLTRISADARQPLTLMAALDNAPELTAVATAAVADSQVV